MVLTSEAPDVTPLTEEEQQNLRSVADVLQYWNSHDIDGVLTFYDDEITWFNMPMEEVYRGKDAVRNYLGQMFHAFPDLTFEVTFRLPRGSQVAEQWVIRGTHRGTFFGIPATGRPVEIQGMGLVELRDGKFLRDRFYFDSGAVLRQMGLLPPLWLNTTLPGRVFFWLAVSSLRLFRGILGGLRFVRRRKPSPMPPPGQRP